MRTHFPPALSSSGSQQISDSTAPLRSRRPTAQANHAGQPRRTTARMSLFCDGQVAVFRDLTITEQVWG